MCNKKNFKNQKRKKMIKIAVIIYKKKYIFEFQLTVNL